MEERKETTTTTTVQVCQHHKCDCIDKIHTQLKTLTDMLETLKPDMQTELANMFELQKATQLANWRSQLKQRETRV